MKHFPAIAFAFGIFCVTVMAEGSNTGNRDGAFRIGMPRSIVSGLSEADAKITMQQIVSNSGLIEGNFITEIFPDSESFHAAIKSGRISLYPLRTVEMLQLLEQGVSLTPVLVPKIHENGSLTTFVLLRKSPGKLPVGLKKGATLALHVNGDFDLGRIWLNSRVKLLNEGTIDNFFSKVTLSKTSNEAVLSVFFEKSDYCLVRKRIWEALGELNPQLLKSLVPVAESEPLQENVVCFNSNILTRPTALKVKQNLLSMHESSRGLALLTVTKVLRFDPFEEHFLDGVKKLMEQDEDENRVGGISKTKKAPGK